jgi:hypothetical protein
MRKDTVCLFQIKTASLKVSERFYGLLIDLFMKDNGVNFQTYFLFGFISDGKTSITVFIKICLSCQFFCRGQRCVMYLSVLVFVQCVHSNFSNYSVCAHKSSWRQK